MSIIFTKMKAIVKSIVPFFMRLLALNKYFISTVALSNSCCVNGQQCSKTATTMSVNHCKPTTQVSTSKTFYRRSLPLDSCTALSSPKGRKFFASAMDRGGLKSFFPLIEQHLTQSELAYCGISTLVIALNALAVDPRRSWKGPWRWYEESMLNCGLDSEKAKSTGITLNNFKCLALCQGLEPEVVYSDHNQDTFEDRFRQAVITACSESGIVSAIQENDGSEAINDNVAQQLERVLVVSYDRGVLGQTGTGHFSPLAAYDCNSDNVLIMDTARFKYGAHWVPLKLLAKAMEPIDPDTGRSRGFVMLENPMFVENQSGGTIAPSNVASSIFFRPQRIPDTLLLELKHFLEEKGSVSYSNLARFWSKEGKAPTFIMEFVQPNFLPIDNDHGAMSFLNEVRALVSKLLSETDGVEAFYNAFPNIRSVTTCRTNRCRTLELSPEEVIYIAYLACISAEQRNEIVYKSCSNEGLTQSASMNAQHQLLAEAEMLSFLFQGTSSG